MGDDEFVAGESDYGTDGFVAALHGEAKQLRWMAFFDSSNPFSALELADGVLRAQSTSGLVWCFSTNDPTSVHVESLG